MSSTILGRVKSSILATAFMSATMFFISSACAQVTSPFNQIGEILVSVEDDPLSGLHHDRFDFIVADGDQKTFYELLFNEPVSPSKMPSGTIARVRGTLGSSPRSSNLILVDELEPLLMNVVTAQAVLGDRKALPVRVVFSDGAPTASISDITNFMWDGSKNINGWFQAASNGNLSFPKQLNNIGGAFVEEVTLFSSKAGCDPMNWASAVDTVLTSRGITLSNFNHILYFLPATGCGWAGLGNVGCFGTCRSWTNNYGSPNTSTADVMFHELGHNLSLNHARTDPTNSGIAACEYCDTSSGMGYGGIGYRGFTAHSQEQLGWLPAERATSANSGTFTLYPTEVNATTASPALPGDAEQLIRVPFPSDSSKYFLVTLRSRIGIYASDLGNTYHNKVSIHWGRLSDTYTYLITTLSTGDSYSSGGVTISHISNNGTSSIVVIQNGTTPVPTATPTTVPSGSPTAGPSPTPSISPTVAPTQTPQQRPTVALPFEPTATPIGGGQDPAPTPAFPTPEATPDPGSDSTGLAVISVKGYRGTAVLSFISTSEIAYSILRNGRSAKILNADTYRVTLTPTVKGRQSGKRRNLGRISVSATADLTPQRFQFQQIR